MKNSRCSTFNKLILATASFLLSSTLFLGCSGSGDINHNPRNPYGLGPAPVSLSRTGSYATPAGDLGSAGNYVIMSKTGVSNVTGSMITGNVAVSPAAASYITGFSLVADASNVFSTSSSVVGGGKVYAADYAPPTPANLTSAIDNMQTAYTTAAGRSPPDFLELGAGAIGGLTLAPGLYTWGGTVTIPTNVTISGGANDVWIFQIAGNLTMSTSTNVILGGQAQSKNIYWQVAGQVTIGANSDFKGIILSKTAVTLLNLATMNGRIFSQTAVALDNNTIVQP